MDDAEYEAAGATIVDVDGVWAEAEMVLKVKEPLDGEYQRLSPGQILFTYLHLAAAPELTRGLCETGRGVHRLRDGRDARRPAAAARADERGRGPAVGPGRRVLPDEAAAAGAAC